MPDEATLVAFAEVLAAHLTDLRRAAELPFEAVEPYRPPPESSRLSRRQRRAVDEIIRAMVEPAGTEAPSRPSQRRAPPGAVAPSHPVALSPAPRCRVRAIDEPGDGPGDLTVEVPEPPVRRKCRRVRSILRGWTARALQVRLRIDEPGRGSPAAGGGYDPWLDLRPQLAAASGSCIEPMYDDLLGELRLDDGVIALRAGTSAAQRRCTLAHEIVHLERGRARLRPWLDREERAVHATATRRLISIDELISRHSRSRWHRRRSRSGAAARRRLRDPATAAVRTGPTGTPRASAEP